MSTMDLHQEITEQRRKALEKITTPENRDAAEKFLKNEVVVQLTNWWCSTANYRCITFYKGEFDYVVYNKNVRDGFDVSDPVYNISAEILSVAVEIAADFGITAVEYAETGTHAWRFEIHV